MSLDNLIQAVVLAAGTGSKMTSLVQKSPKCTLPVGHFPMIYYSLRFLEKSGFSEATVLARSSEKEELSNAISKFRLNIKVKCIYVSDADDPQPVETLRAVKEHVNKTVLDILILSCDLITDVNFLDMYEYHEKHGGRLTILGGEMDLILKKRHPSDVAKRFASTLFFGEKSGRLLHIIPPGSSGKGKFIDYSSALVSKELAAITNSIFDAQMYIMSQGCFRYMLSDRTVCKHMVSLQCEVIPHLVELQYKQETDQDMLGIEKFEKDFHTDNFMRTRETGSWRFGCNSPESFCGIYQCDSLCLRVNTYSAFWLPNTQMISTIYSKLQIDSSNVGKKLKILQNVKDGQGRKFTNAYIADEGHFGDSIQITNSLIGENVNIPSGCVIEDSVILDSLAKKVTIVKCIVTDWTALLEHGEKDEYRDLIA